VGNAGGVCLGRFAERLERRNDRVMLAEVGEDSGLGGGATGGEGQDLRFELGDSLPCESRGMEDGEPMQFG